MTCDPGSLRWRLMVLTLTRELRTAPEPERLGTVRRIDSDVPPFEWRAVDDQIAEALHAWD